jgi:hypothetical protein
MMPYAEWTAVALLAAAGFWAVRYMVREHSKDRERYFEMSEKFTDTVTNHLSDATRVIDRNTEVLDRCCTVLDRINGTQQEQAGG